MKKRLLCILMVFVMIVPFVLSACGQDEEDKMKEIILGGGDEKIDRALTLSIWLPTDAITIKGKTADLSELSQQERISLSQQYPDVYEFLKRVDAVEDAINKVLISRNYYTNIDIVPVYTEYYEEAIDERFAKMDEESDPFEMNARGDSDEYANEVVKETVGSSTLYNLLYRPVDPNQLDIFIIRDYGDKSGYDRYREYITKNYLIPLDKTTEPSPPSEDEEEDDDSNKEPTLEDIHNQMLPLYPKTNYITESGSYASINKLIRKSILQQFQVKETIGNLTYALPCNHLYSSQKFFAIDKVLFEEYAENYRVADFSDFANLANYISYVAKYEENVVPLYVNGMMPAFGAVNLENLTYGTNVGTDEEKKNYFGMANEILSDDSFISFVQEYKKLKENGLIFDSIQDDQKVAVKLLEGTSVEEINKLSKDYYLVPADKHTVTHSELYSSMLAISSFTVDYDRSMKILNLLLSDSEIVTMLQYGIKNEDYNIETEVRDGKEVETIKLPNNPTYVMNNLYTGSSYYTYPHNGAAIDDWDGVKQANVNIVLNQFFNAKYVLSSTDGVYAKKQELANLASAAFEEIDAMTLEEFNSFINKDSDGYAEVIQKYANANKFATSKDYLSLIKLYVDRMK